MNFGKSTVLRKANRVFNMEGGKYWITAPTTVTPYTNYTITVQILDAPSHTPVHMQAVLYLKNTSAVVAQNDGDFQTGQLGMLSLYVPEISLHSNYTLQLRGTGGLQIEERKELILHPRVATVYIETDRTYYEPGQKVNIATFALRDSDLKPFTEANYTVSLVVENILMKEWTSSTDAVSKFVYELDKHAPLGMWTITTYSPETGNATYQFQVEKYEKPPFHVNIHIPKTINSSTPLHGYVTASHPHGVDVQGIAKVTVIQGGASRALLINGNVSFTFSYNDLDYAYTDIRATVAEEYSDLTASTQAYVQIYERDVKIEIMDETPAVIWPGLPFTVYIQITDNSGQPLNIPEDSVFRTVYVYGVGHYRRPTSDHRFSVYSAFYGSFPILTLKTTLPLDGKLRAELDIPSDVTEVDLIVTFQGKQKSVTLQTVQSSSHNYLQVLPVGDMPSVDSEHPAHAVFQVTSNKAIPTVNVQLISRGRVVQAFQPTLTHRVHSPDLYTAQFDVELAWDMTPVTQMIVYYVIHDQITSRNELVADSLALNVRGFARNKVQLTSNGTRVEPGQVIGLHVQAQPDSTVGVLVYEQGAMQDSITLDKILSMAYERVDGPKPPLSSAYQPAGTAKAAFAFMNAGFFILYGTSHCPNGDYRCANGECIYPTAECDGYDRCGDMSDESHCTPTRQRRDTRRAEQPPSAGEAEPKTEETDAPERTKRSAVDLNNLPALQVSPAFQVSLGGDNTIFFDTGTTASDGSANFLVQLPNIVTTWAATAFAFDQEGRVGASENPLLIEAFREVYVDVYGAKHLVAGEHFNIRVDVHNTRSSKAQVDVTVKAPSWLQTWEVKIVSAADDTAETQAGPLTRSVTVRARGTASVYFPILADYQQSHGDFNVIVVEALSGTSRHEVEFTYTVVPEGVKQTHTESEVITVNGPATYRLSVSSPGSAVQGEEYYRMFVSDNIDTVPLMASLEGWDVTEEGAGPDALLHLAMPVIMAKNHPDRVDSLRRSMELAYQRLIHFLDTDYLARVDSLGRPIKLENEWFRNTVGAKMFSGSETSERMTLRILKAMCEARRYITVDEVFIEVALRRIDEEKDLTDPVKISALQTCHEFLNDGVFRELFTRIVSKLNNPERFFIHSQLEDPWIAGQLALASSLVGVDPVAYVNTALRHAITDPATGEIYWETPRDGYGQHVPSPDDVTLASYVLSTSIKIGKHAEAEGIAKWLLRHRDIQGKFRCGCDTLAATEALSEYAASLQQNSTATATFNGRQLINTVAPITSDAGLFDISADGTGTLYAQAEVTYYTKETRGETAFEVVPVTLNENLHHFTLMVCSRYLGSDSSGPVVQEVDLPSGFTANATELHKQKNVVGTVQRNDTHIAVYFSTVEDQSSCYTLQVDRVHPVAETAPSYILTRRYTAPAYQDIVSYQPKRLTKSSLCDVCIACCLGP